MSLRSRIQAWFRRDGHAPRVRKLPAINTSYNAALAAQPRTMPKKRPALLDVQVQKREKFSLRSVS